MARYFIDISFDGTAYAGWQKQQNALSVQQVLEEKFSLKLKEQVGMIGCGRTDAGVHARQFIAHLDTNVHITDKDFIYKMNRFLLDDIVINDIYPVKPSAHARFSAIQRTYCYYISTRKNPFIRQYSYEYISPIDVNTMNQAAAFLLEVDDFTSFTKLHGGSKHARCTLYDSRWIRQDDMLIYTITANRFTRNMVRSIVGTLLEVGKGNIDVETFKQIVAAKNRCVAGESIEAKGLFLEKVVYPSKVRI